MVGEVVVVEENFRWQGRDVRFVSKTPGEFRFVLEVHFMSLEEGLADLGKEIFGPTILEEAAFPSEDFGAIREKNVLIREGRDKCRIHQRRGIAGARESGVGSGGDASRISEGVIRLMAGQAGLAGGIRKGGVGKNETPDLGKIGRLVG